MADPIFAIARSALDVERQRLAVIAQNLANAGTTGQIYSPKRLISGPQSIPSFTGMLGTQGATEDRQASLALSGVQSYGVEEIDAAPRRVHEPENPAADESGYVNYPGVNQAEEMALLVQTLRVYEANVVMCNAARAMFMRAMDIGGKS